MEERGERKLKPSRRSPLAVIEDASLTAEKMRVAATVRLKHLAKKGMTCPYTEELLKRVTPLEEWADGTLAELIGGHPTWWWLSHLKGIGRENVSKPVGEIENFGRYYDVGDPEIPFEVKREPEEYIFIDENDKEVVKIGIWVEGIERLLTPSKQRVLGGHAPGLERKRGVKHSYNAKLKMLFWRVGTSFVRVGDGSYADFYHLYKAYLVVRTDRDGGKIILTPKERFCPKCEKEVVKKAAKFCPDCKGPLSLKQEPPGVLYLGHLDLMARRRMQQLFSDHLNIVWRKTLGLFIRVPYPVEYLGHSAVIGPGDMMDKSCGRKDCPVCGGEAVESVFQLRHKEDIKRALETLGDLKERLKLKGDDEAI